MKKKILSVILLVLLFSLAGCKKVVSTNELRVNAFVENVYHKNATVYLQYNAATETYQTITDPEINRVSVRYNGKTHYINNESAFMFCKNKVGWDVPCILEVKTYDDGTTKEEIVAVIQDESNREENE